MGMIKRIIGRTSRKILSTIVPNSQSDRFILNQPVQPNDIATSLHKSTRRKVNRLNNKLKKATSKDTAVADALLLAAKNHLPPVQFHHVHGPNAKLSSNKCVAQRTQSFCQALVFSSRVILPNERVYIKVLEIAKGWSGTIRFGFTAVDPATLAYRMPKHACPDMTNAGHTWARALADEVVRRNSVIHFSYNKDGFIHYGINNQDCGIFHANVNTNQNLWFIVDIYGLTAAIELFDPRMNNSAALLEAGDHRSNTTFKSTSMMDDIFGANHHHQSASSRSRRKQFRKAARYAAAMGVIHGGQWPLERGAFPSSQLAGVATEYQQQQLPNLNSITLPSAEQNIYSPMPNNQVLSHQQRSRSQQRIVTAPIHDYHHIMTNDSYSTNSVHDYQRVRGQTKLSAAASVANLSGASSSSTSFNNTSTASSSSSATHTDKCRDICRQFKDIRLNTVIHQSGTPKQSLSRSSKSITSVSLDATHQSPVAAARRRASPANTPVQTNSKRSPDSRTQTKATNHRVGSSSTKPNTLSSSSVMSPSMTTNKPTTSNGTIAASASSSACKENVKPRTRHSKSSTPIAASITNSDNNDNAAPSKDCPICFERPINCVLYQCGHMCTCYECGVKQWKTQSRTCPICRTIIKDVIKTYMS